MSLTMYTASMPAMKHMLSNLSAILMKAEQYAASRKIDPAALLSSRLYPDMFPLLRQILIATDHAKGCAARLAGIEVPKFDDTETTFAELQARIAKTLAFMESVRPEQFAGSEERDLEFKAGPNTFQFKGQDYLNHWALPNFYFHLTTAYAILRHNGLEIGKRDYLGGR